MGISTSRGRQGALGLVALVFLLVLGMAALWFWGKSDSAVDGVLGSRSSGPVDPGQAAAERDAQFDPRQEGLDGSLGTAALIQPEEAHRKTQRPATGEGSAGDARVANQPNAILVEGSVRDARNAAPLGDVTVRLETSARASGGRGLFGETKTDAEGVFQLRWSADVAADLSLLRAGFVDARRPDVPLLDFLELQLEPSARIHGQVVGVSSALAAAESGATLKAIAWYASTSSERLWERLETDLLSSGEFAFDDLLAGDYVLCALVPGRVVPFMAGVHVEAGEEREVQLEALPSATVRGRVLLQPLEKGGIPRGVAGAVLEIEPNVDGLPADALATRSADTVSDEQGYFEFDGFAPGSHHLLVNLPWAERVKRNVDVATSGETVEIEVFCRTPARLAGRLIDAEGEPVGRARVALFIEKDKRRRAQMTDWTFDAAVPQVTTDSAGAFAFEACPAKASMTLAVRRLNQGIQGLAAPALLSIPMLRPGEERLDEVYVLPADAGLQGRVLDPAGRPVFDAKIELYTRAGKLGTRVAMTTSDAAGSFFMRRVPVGAATLFASAPQLLSVTQVIEIDASGAEVELVLFEALAVDGVALDQAGIAIEGVPIQLTFDPESKPAPEHARRRQKHVTVTDAFGRFRFESLFDGVWLVRGGSFEWELVGADPGQLRPSEAGWTTLTFAARDRAERFTITGRVEAADGLPPQGLRIDGLRGGLLEFDRGRFVASGLTPTTHRLIIHGDGHRQAVVGPIAPRPGAEVDVGLIALELACRVTVRVVDKQGKPVPKPTVFLAPLPLDLGGPQDQRRVTLTPKGKDRYRTSQAARAKYRLVIKAKGFVTYRAVFDLEQKASLSKRIRLTKS